MRTLQDLVSVYLALAVVPLAPLLTASYLGVPWQGLVLAAGWAVAWYLWLLGRLRSG